MDEKGRILVARDGVTTPMNKVFAGGDAVTGAATLIGAHAAGRKAAEAICKANG